MTPADPHPLHVVILAAGQGTRMKSKRPKVIHEVGGRPMLGRVLDVAQELGAAAIHVVHGHGAEQVLDWFKNTHPQDKTVKWVLQAQQLGTGHAVRQVLPDVPDHARVLVLYGDVPLITAQTLRELLAATNGGLAILTTRLDEPHGYGRILRDGEGEVTGIVEDKDATAAQRRINEVNTGILGITAKLLKLWVPKLKNSNAKGEYYLTDIVAMAADAAVHLKSVEARAEEVEGINDRAQLARAERVFQRRQAEQLAHKGLGIRDLARFDLRGQLHFGADCTVDVGVVMEGEIEIADNVSIGPYCVLKNVKLGAGTRVEAHSVLESVEAGKDCRIGPFARVRPETKLADEVHVGNFVEVKKGTLGKGSKANHLAYIGDATIGARVNVGAGTITCNYDGANKHQTVIEDDVFIGSDTQLVAPVKVGAGATIGAGSTISKDVPPGGLTVCRAREQTTLPGWRRPTKKK